MVGSAQTEWRIQGVICEIEILGVRHDEEPNHSVCSHDDG
jgi:hypothetical protein